MRKSLYIKPGWISTGVFFIQLLFLTALTGQTTSPRYRLQLQVQADVTPAYCNGVCSGKVKLHVNGGVSPYQFTWANAVIHYQQDSAWAICPGNYAVTVTDQQSDTAIATFTIGEMAALQAMISTTPENCGRADGTAQIDTVWQAHYPLQYQWNDPDSQQTAIAWNLPSGQYHVTITDDTGCYVIETVNIPAAPALVVYLVATDLACHGEQNAVAIATATGGSPPYQYLWNDPDSQTTATATGLSAGTYTVTVYDNAGCQTSRSITINEPDPITVHPVIHHVRCYGGNDGRITLQVSGGTLPYQFQWDDPNQQTSPTVFGLSAGEYHVTITDNNYCDFTDTITIRQPDSLSIFLTSIPSSSVDHPDGAISVSVMGGTPPYSYLWSHDPTINSDSVPGLTPGVYHVTVTDSNGCAASDSAVVEYISASNYPDVLPYKVWYLPEHNTLRFRGNAGWVRLTLWDITGRRPFSRDYLTPVTIPLPDLPGGIYLLTLENPVTGEMKTLRISYP